MIRRSLFAFPVAALLLCGGGCLVTKSSYDLKARENDSLREAVASLNREKARLAEENAELSKQVAAGKRTEAALSAQVREADKSLERLGEGMTGSPRIYDKGQTTREQFIDGLLEVERTTGLRMQELSARVECCEKELSLLRSNASSREHGAGRLAALSADLAEVSPEIGITPIGPSLRIVVPERLLVGERGACLTKTGAAIVSKISGAVSELPSASLLILTGGKASAETVRAAAASNGRIPRERLHSRVGERGGTAELFVVMR